MRRITNDWPRASTIPLSPYPHIRLARTFARFESAEEYVELSRRGEAHLQQEGWDHTEIASIEAIQMSDDKVHLVMQNHRCRESGEVYNAFDTLWVATLQDGHWGIKFRSSHLR